MGESQPIAIGIDLGGTKIHLAQVDAFGIVRKHLRIPTDAKGGPEAVKKQILEAIAQLNENTSDSIVGIGIGVAGQIDPHHGIVQFAPNLDGWHQVPLQSNISQELKLPVAVANDVRVATWGEWLYGAGKGCQDLVCIFVGTGIGGGLVSGGKILEGFSNTAGEIGHMVVDLHGPHCTCGNQGCLESLAGGWAIAEQARQAVKADKQAGAYLLKMAEGKLKNLTAKLVIEAVRKKDPLSQSIIANAQEALIAGAISLVNAFNPEKLIFGGGIIEGMPDLIKNVEKGVRKRALKAATASLKILPAQLHQDAGVVGAAALAMHRFGKQTK